MEIYKLFMNLADIRDLQRILECMLAWLSEYMKLVNHWKQYLWRLREFVGHI